MWTRESGGQGVTTPVRKSIPESHATPPLQSPPPPPLQPSTPKHAGPTPLTKQHTAVHSRQKPPPISHRPGGACVRNQPAATHARACALRTALVTDWLVASPGLVAVARHGTRHQLPLQLLVPSTPTQKYHNATKSKRTADLQSISKT